MGVLPQLYSFQSEAVDFCMVRGGSALFFEQGTGKTWVVMGVIEKLAAQLGRPPTTLVIVPLANLETTWLNLLNAHIPQASERTSILNYEAVPPLVKKLRKKRWDLIIYDESQRLKARGSLASRTAKKLADSADKRIILSGTPIEQAPQDLWAQFRFVAPSCFGTRWADFEEEYLRRTGYMGYKRKFIGGKLEQFLTRIKPYALRVKKSEVLTLPPMHIHKVGVELLGNQRRIYDELEESMATTIGTTEVLADLAITQLVRLQQVCGGFLNTDEGSINVGRAKLRRGKILIDRAPKPIVVFAKYLEELWQLQNALGNYRLGVISGDTRKTRSATIEAFQCADIDVLLCQVRTGGVGIDLPQAKSILFYSTTFSFIDWEQALARAHRIGQVNELMVYVLFAKNTVDEDIFLSILNKQSVSEAVLTRLSRRSDYGKGR